MVAKMSQKELAEPDQFQQTMQKVIAYAVERKKIIAAIAGIAVLLIIAGFGWFFYDRDYETSAMNLYNSVFARTVQNPSAVNQQQAVDDYKKMVAKYPRSRAAQLAQFWLGNIYYQEGDIDKAISSYNAFIDKSSSSSDLASLTYTGLGYCYESKKDYSKAITYFEKAVKVRGGNPFEGINERNLARIYEMSADRSKAIEHYRKALEKTTDPSMKRLLNEKIAILA
jgi:tetratricopeptide (TPR) repeat protein